MLTPATVQDAARMLAEEGPHARPVAGATDLFVDRPSRADAAGEVLVDLSGLDALRAREWTDDEFVMGALTTYWDVINDERAAGEFPILARAARTVGAVQIQTRGTWAGNIANASPAADGVPALMALGAVVELTSVDGVDRVPLDGFYTGYKQMKMRPGQVISAVRVPRRARSFESFVKVGSRRAQAITKVGVAITRLDAGWRVVANSMAPVVKRCAAVEHALDNEAPVRTPGDLVGLLEQDLSPIDDIRSTAAYRMKVLARVLYHELAPVCPWIEPGGLSEGKRDDDRSN